MEVYWIHLPGANIKTDGYVGITNNIKQRWAKHKCLVSGSHHLKNAILKYNSDLIWEVIFTGSEEGCTQLEEYFRPEPDIGWNIRSGGKYYNPSEETKEKLRQANLGKKYSEETKAKHRKRWTGVNNPRTNLVNIYEYKTGCLVASSVYCRGWEADNGISRGIDKTIKADRTQKSTKNNKLHHRGYYAILI
jgi:hypothetical protein